MIEDNPMYNEYLTKLNEIQFKSIFSLRVDLKIMYHNIADLQNDITEINFCIKRIEKELQRRIKEE